MVLEVLRGSDHGGRSAAMIGSTLVASVGSASFALLQGWPLWLIGVATLLPWLPVFTLDVARTYQRYRWLALFYVLVVTQIGHCLEHVVQLVQLHVLGLSGSSARGLFDSLDVEWVHLVWNTWVLLAVLVLLSPFGSNRWLWLTALLSGWHGIEHAYIISVYVTTGVSGTPGLLSHGGALASGLPISRPDLHFLYNLIETVPLVLAFLAQCRVSLSARPPRHGNAAIALRAVMAATQGMQRRTPVVLKMTNDTSRRPKW